MTQCITDYTNFLPLFNDLNLDPETDMLWLLHHKQQLTLEELRNKPFWTNKKNIFLIDSEQYLTEDISWQSDSRIHVWTPNVTNDAKHYTYHFWLNWMQEIESYLGYFKKIETAKFKSYYFDALLGTPRAHKNIVKNLIDNSKNKNKFMLSYNGNPFINPTCNWITATNKDIPGEPIMYNSVQEANPTCVIPYKIYNQCWYSLVAETNETQPNFYTEKTGKPLLSKRLFVMFAGQHHLKNLKESGFKTFDGIIDESYDDISDLETRYQQAWKQVEFLLEQDPVVIHKQAESILEYNHNHFMTTDWQKEMYEKIQNISQSSK